MHSCSAACSPFQMYPANMLKDVEGKENETFSSACPSFNSSWELKQLKKREKESHGSVHSYRPHVQLGVTYSRWTWPTINGLE